MHASNQSPLSTMDERAEIKSELLNGQSPFSERDLAALHLEHGSIDVHGHEVKNIETKGKLLDPGGSRLRVYLLLAGLLIVCPSTIPDPSGNFTLQYFEHDGIAELDGWKQVRPFNMFGIAAKNQEFMYWVDLRQRVCSMRDSYLGEDENTMRAMRPEELSCQRWSLCRQNVAWRCTAYDGLFWRCFSCSTAVMVALLTSLLALYSVYKEEQVRAVKNVPTARLITFILCTTSSVLYLIGVVYWHAYIELYFGTLERIQYMPNRGCGIGALMCMIGLVLVLFAALVSHRRWKDSKMAVRRLQKVLEAMSSESDHSGPPSSDDSDHPHLTKFNPKFRNQLKI